MKDPYLYTNSEVLKNLAGIHDAEELKNMESLLGYSDPDLTLIRMEILRRRKNENYEKSK